MPEYLIPGQVFKPQADFFVKEFSDYLANNEPYPIDRIFDIFPIRPEGERNKTKIIQRGNINISNGTLSNNYSVPTSTSFVGDGVGQISLTLPRSVLATAISSDTSLSISFDTTPIRVRMTDLAPKLGYKLEMLLRQLIFEPTNIKYVFKAEDVSGTELELLIVVDLTKDEIVEIERNIQKNYEGEQNNERSNLPMFTELFSGGCCVVKPGSAPPEIPKDWKQRCQVEFQFVRAVPGGTDPGPGYRQTITGYGEDEDEAVEFAVEQCKWRHKGSEDNYCQIFRVIVCESRSGG